MKSLPDPSNPIWGAWGAGGYLGGRTARPHGRVTVEPGYWLNTSYKAGSFPWLPVRWYQRADNSQVEIEVPGIISIDQTKSIDSDADTCQIVLNNQMMDAFGTVRQGPDSVEFGNPGYMTPDRGTLSNRWNYEPNEWQGVLGVNALIRTYQGYGGHGKTIQQAVADGNLVLTGVWLVDDVDFMAGGNASGGSSSGGATITLNCRSMAKLLIDQEVFPGLVPLKLYPISFFTDNMDVGAEYPEIIYGHTTGSFPPATPTGVYVVGIESAPTSDGYWLVGTDGGVFAYGDTHFLGSAVGTLVSGDWVIGMAVTPDGNGYWLATSFGYVYAYGNATYWGGVNTPGTNVIAIERVGADGYILVNNVGHVYSFGADFFGGTPGGASTIVAAAARPQGDGYWMCDSHGHVYSFGSAAYFGGAPSGLAGPITGMASTPSGNGYYLVGSDGGVFTFGDAVFLGSVPSTYTSTVTYTDAEIQNGSSYITLGADQTATTTPQAIPFAHVYGPMVPDGSLDVPVAAVAGDTVDFVVDLILTGPVANPLKINVGIVNGNQQCVTGDLATITAAGTYHFTGSYTVGATDVLNNGPVYNITYEGGGATVTKATLTANDASIHDTFQPSDVGHPLTIDSLDPLVNIPPGITITNYVNPQKAQISWTATADLIPVTIHIQRTPTHIVLNDPVTDIAPAPNGLGYWLGAQDGGVFTYSEVERNQFGTIVWAVKFEGSMPGAFTYYLPGNYADFVDIIAYFLLWSGFWLNDGGYHGNVYGNIETTGTHSTDIIDSSTLDKQPVINVMHTIKQVVGFLFYIDDEGAAHFHEPNTWEQGNNLADGSRTTVIPVVDERIQITGYTRSNPDASLRSDIIVASEDPYPEGPAGSPAPAGTITTSFVPTQAPLLKGLQKPAMWFNETFIQQTEQQIMAQLIALQIYFQSQTGNLTMPANPMLQIDDQVQIVERTSFELNYHYIRGITTHMDFTSGEYSSQLTTNILGNPETPLFVSRPDGSPTGAVVITRALAGGQGITSVAT